MATKATTNGVTKSSSPTTTKTPSTKKSWKQIGTLLIDLDIPLLIFCILTSGLVHWVLGARTNLRPFLLHDASVWYPIKPPTVPIQRVFAIAFFIYFPIIVYFESRPTNHNKNQSTHTRRIVALRYGMGLLCALFLAVIFVEAGKNIVGRLRPSFAEICMGGGDNEWRDVGGYGKSVQEVECKNVDLKKVKDGRRSFPSGHSAVAVGTAFYLQLWLMRWVALCEIDGIWAQVLLLVGMGPMAWGFWVACSRVFDNAHRVSDILAGGFVGMWAAGVCFYHVVKESSIYVKRVQRESEGSNMVEDEKKVQ